MLYQEEKFKKLVKIVFWLMGAFLFIGLFTLFNGGKNSPSNRDFSAKDSGGINEQSDASNKTISSMSYSDEMAGSAGRGMSSVSSMSESPTTVPVEAEETIADKKIVKNGNITLKVGDTEWAVEKISKIAREKGGEVFTTNLYERIRGQKSGFVTIKVPVDKFEDTIKDIKKIATQVLSESTTGQDVTEQYVDLQAQLKNKKALQYILAITVFIIIIPSLFIFKGGSLTSGINTSILLQSEIVFTFLIYSIIKYEKITLINQLF